MHEMNERVSTPQMKAFVTELAQRHKLNLASIGESITLQLPGYSDLSISVISATIIAVNHHYVQNGDVMFDPSIDFFVAPATGNWIPIDFIQHPTIHWITVELNERGTEPVLFYPSMLYDVVAFVEDMWVPNLQAQGWLNEATVI